MQKRDKRITALLRWFGVHGRTLPWRFIDDPYAIFISEIMLQQTQAARVTEYFERWLTQFPTWESLAHAKTPELLKAWAGLGYNRRALYLREAAKTVVQKGIPRTETEWRLLKGVGPYTASAVYAFTAKRPAAAIDTNIRRVIGRIALGLPFPTLQDDPAVGKVLRRMLTKETDWIALHALMDLGATICTPKSPRCSVCPLRTTCKARRYFAGAQISTSKNQIKKKKERVHEGKKFPDRIYRGKILSVLRERKTISVRQVGSLIDPTYDASRDDAWVLRMIDRMKKDGFIEEKNDQLRIFND
jgi:A/G-specific adenine glycosylase